MRPQRAFNSETQAYVDYFQSRGHSCVEVETGSSLLEYDVAILFNGFFPFWQRYPPIVVSEYQSLSTGSFPKLKNRIKRLVNKRGDIFVFLNDYVREGMAFGDAEPYILRPMGYFHSAPRAKEKGSLPYDLVYAGSDRQGLENQVRRLIGLGLEMLLVGHFPWAQDLRISVSQPVRPLDVPPLLDLARAGLNFVPNREPYIFQDSTKVVEYASRGLGVVSNSYYWVDTFMNARNGRYLDLGEVRKKADVTDFPYRAPEISDLRWDLLLDNSGLVEQIETHYFD